MAARPRRGNPWPDRRVLAWAHRGGGAEGPENTLAAMRRARAAGAHGLELDVHLTADGHLVVRHDPVLQSTTDRTGAIAASTLDQIRRLDAAWWFVPGEGTRPGRPADAYPWRGRAGDDPDYRVPTLGEVLAAFPDAYVNIDMKAAGTEAPLAAAIAQAGAADRVIVASFSDRRLARFRALAPHVATSAGSLRCWAFAAARRAWVARPPFLVLQLPHRHRRVPALTAAMVADAHRSGLAVHAWTVDEPADIERVLDAGVDGVMTDRPTVLAGVLGARGGSRPAG